MDRLILDPFTQIEDEIGLARLEEVDELRDVALDGQDFAQLDERNQLAML